MQNRFITANRATARWPPCVPHASKQLREKLLKLRKCVQNHALWTCGEVANALLLDLPRPIPPLAGRLVRVSCVVGLQDYRQRVGLGPGDVLDNQCVGTGMPFMSCKKIQQWSPQRLIAGCKSIGCRGTGTGALPLLGPTPALDAAVGGACPRTRERARRKSPSSVDAAGLPERADASAAPAAPAATANAVVKCMSVSSQAYVARRPPLCFRMNLPPRES